MTVSSMRSMTKSARNKAEAVAHSMKDRALEKQLDRTSEESERLRIENDLLRDEVAASRSEHQRILDLLDTHLAETTEPAQPKEKKRRHRGRWLLVLTAIGGGAYALSRRRTAGELDAMGMPDGGRGSTGSGTATL
jgi:hypothetical protein